MIFVRHKLCIKQNSSILHYSGEGWKMHRKNINPCFSAGIINSYFPMINKAAKVFVNTTNQHIDEKTINLRNNLGAMSLDMITGRTH